MATIAVTSSDVKITWEHGGSSNTVMGYNFYYGPSNRLYTNVVSTGYVTNMILTNVPLNGPVFISGTTIGFDNLETEYGNEVQVTILPITNNLPSAVKDFVLTRLEKTIY